MKFFAKKNIQSLNLFFTSLILLTLISCADGRLFFMAQEQEEVRKIERADHQYCIALGLDFGDDNPLKTEIYWRCRIILADNKIIPEAITPSDIRNNIMMNRIIKTIKDDYEDAFEKSNDSRNSLFDNNDHEKCVNLGFNMETLDKETVEEYYVCRKKFILEQQIIPPFFNDTYFNRGQDTYNVPFALNKDTDLRIKAYEETKARYPYCVKYYTKDDDKFFECIKAFEDQKVCYTKIPKAEISKLMLEKSLCQRKSYLRFPDSMIKNDDSRNKEIQKTTLRADNDYKNNFSSLGITPDKFDIFKAKTEEEKKQEKKEEVRKNFNTKNELYTRNELGRIKQDFLALCNQEGKVKTADYVAELNRECAASTKMWEVK